MDNPELEAAADLIADAVLALIRVYRDSGLHQAPDRHQILTNSIDGLVMDTYQTAAYQILGVLSLIPQHALQSLPRLRLISGGSIHKSEGDFWDLKDIRCEEPANG